MSDHSSSPLPTTVDIPSKPDYAKAIISIVIGSLCIILVWVKIIVLFLAPLFMMISGLGIILAILSKKRNNKLGVSTAPAIVGLVLNIIVLFINTLLSALFLLIAVGIFTR